MFELVMARASAIACGYRPSAFFITRLAALEGANFEQG
jgi:hypothetical protein